MGFFFGKSAPKGAEEHKDNKEEKGMQNTMINTSENTEKLAAGEAAPEREHYDGSTMEDVFGQYGDARMGRVYVPVHFIETRKYLQQVRDQKHRIELLEDRIKYRADAGLDTAENEKELAMLKDELKFIVAEVSDEISKVGDVNLELILTKRYIEVLSWDEVAETTDFKMRTVQKFHGKALPAMEDVLYADGLIELGEQSSYSGDEG